MVVPVKLRTADGWRTVQALLDSGATMNFVAQMTVKKLGLEPKER